MSPLREARPTNSLRAKYIQTRIDFENKIGNRLNDDADVKQNDAFFRSC
jgi:hypothetical protein